MAQYLYFSRDTKVYVKIGSDIWEVPVLDGFSFSQATNASEIVLAEMESAGGVSRRGKRMFNDALAPAEWSFTTYTRPFASAGGGAPAAASTVGQVHAVEEVLWALMAGPAFYEGNTFKDGTGGTAYFNWNTAEDSLTIDWGTSNKSTLGTASIIFKVGSGSGVKYYETTNCVVNEATIDFDIDGIASINWSGMGSLVQEIAGPITPTITEGITSTTNFIRNRLTQLSVVPTTSGLYATGSVESSYNVTLTGGSITVSNNITYITPEELGIVNYPIGHVTGNRSVSGNFTAYLVDDDGNTNETGDFWADMAALTSIVTHDFALTFNVGGSTGDPRLTFTIPTATIEIPTHSIEDIISLETNFSGLPSTIDATDEMTVSYYSTNSP
jgi:hypothetical protein